jgi:predicted lipid-binding transport protein (Tim44 family)
VSPDPSPNSQVSAFEIALQWANLPPEHLRIALTALEPQLARDHELCVQRLAMQEAKDRRTHMLYMFGMMAGFILAAAMLGAAVVVGINGQAWLAALLSGPSMIALVTLFILRRSDASTIKTVEQSQHEALQAANQSIPPASPTLPL